MAQQTTLQSTMTYFT